MSPLRVLFGSLSKYFSKMLMVRLVTPNGFARGSDFGDLNLEISSCTILRCRPLDTIALAPSFANVPTAAVTVGGINGAAATDAAPMRALAPNSSPAETPTSRSPLPILERMEGCDAFSVITSDTAMSSRGSFSIGSSIDAMEAFLERMDSVSVSISLYGCAIEIASSSNLILRETGMADV